MNEKTPSCPRKLSSLSPGAVSFINNSFRNIADQDYICARSCYFMRLDTQYLWSALQAIEKYSKAILLYNGCSTKKLNHDLEKIIRRIERICDLEFSLPDEVKNFIKEINLNGRDRYLSEPQRILPGSLDALDRSVWCIRRYCFYTRLETVAIREGKTIDWFEICKKKATEQINGDSTSKHTIISSYLDTVLNKSRSNSSTEAYTALVRQNRYFCDEKTDFGTTIIDRSSFQIPVIDKTLHPDVYQELNSIVDMPKYIKENL